MQCLEIWGGIKATRDSASVPGLDVWVLSRPHQGDEAGGDIHYVSMCGTGRISRVLIADVSGHGAKVADLATTLRNSMRRYMNSIDQTSLVERLNREFGADENMGRFATAVVSTFYAPSRVWMSCNAGHPRPIVYSVRKDAWRALAESAEQRRQIQGQEIVNAPLGVMDETMYRPMTLRMAIGDLIVLYTDSLIEARLPNGQYLGEEGLLDIVRAVADETGQGVNMGVDASKRRVFDGGAFAGAILNAVVRRCGDVEPDDDITIMVLRVNGQGGYPGFFAKLRTQLSFVGMVLRSLIPGGPPVPWPEMSASNLLGPLLPSFNRAVGAKAPLNGD